MGQAYQVKNDHGIEVWFGSTMIGTAKPRSGD
jgi:hypothetical protein